MTNSLPWKDPPIFKFGKPKISGYDLCLIYSYSHENAYKWTETSPITEVIHHEIIP